MNVHLRLLKGTVCVDVGGGVVVVVVNVVVLALLIVSDHMISSCGQVVLY